MPTRIDCEMAILGALGFTGSLCERELAWLQSWVGPEYETLPDAWVAFLQLKGAEGESRADLERSFLIDQGSPEYGLVDGWNWYWEDSGLVEAGPLRSLAQKHPLIRILRRVGSGLLRAAMFWR